jgi:hypothetical protein
VLADADMDERRAREMPFEQDLMGGSAFGEKIIPHTHKNALVWQEKNMTPLSRTLHTAARTLKIYANKSENDVVTSEARIMKHCICIEMSANYCLVSLRASY